MGSHQKLAAIFALGVLAACKDNGSAVAPSPGAIAVTADESGF